MSDVLSATPCTETTLPAGAYWVGDPCYFAPHDRIDGETSEWLKGDDPPRVLHLRLNDGAHVVWVLTMHGDGSYMGSDGYEYGVDGGTLGAVSADAAEDPHDAHYVEFPEPFTVSYSPDGKVTIGHIVIETDDDGDEWGWS